MVTIRPGGKWSGWSNWLLAGVLGMLMQPAYGYQVSQIQLAGAVTTVIVMDPAVSTLALFQNDAQGRPLSSFKRLKKHAHQQGQRIRLAMNAGMYHPDRRPVGLLVQDGRELNPLNRSDGYGNFFMKPNGVFALTMQNQSVILPTAEYPQWAGQHEVRLATQSGPLLLHQGHIHPALTAPGRSAKIRNAIGHCHGRLTWLIIHQPITLYRLAESAREQLGCTDLLYLDGSISSLLVDDWQQQRDRLGPILAVVEPDAPSVR